MKETELRLEFLGKGDVIPPFSGQNCTQTLTMVPQAVLRRTVNGELICVNGGGHQKFHSIIRSKDKAPPAFDGIWKGTLLKVRCIQCMTQIVEIGKLYTEVEREGFDYHLYDSKGKPWATTAPKKKWMAIPIHFPGGFITYRPILTMMVKSYTLETDEWGLCVGWVLELEEK